MKISYPVLYQFTTLWVFAPAQAGLHLQVLWKYMLNPLRFAASLLN